MNASDLSEAFFLLLFFGNGDEEKQFALHLGSVSKVGEKLK